VAIVGGLGSIVIRAVTYAPIPPNMFGLGEGSMIGFVRALGLGSDRHGIRIKRTAVMIPGRHAAKVSTT